LKLKIRNLEQWNPGTMEPGIWNLELNKCQVLKRQNVEFVPVFDVYQNKFLRYELPVNHENNIKS
jgi:hypothetical protein